MAAAIGVAAVAMPWPARASHADTTIPPVTINGEGSFAQYQYVTQMANDMMDAKSPVDVEYRPKGTYGARQDFLAGNLDFVITGAPFTTDELASLKSGANSLITAPVAVGALGYLLAPPLPNGFVSVKQVCDPNDPDVPNPDDCLVRTPYQGPWRVPAENLAPMLLNDAATSDDGLPYRSWQAKPILQAFGVDEWTMGPLVGPAVVSRSEIDETNLYMQQWVKTAAPQEWARIQAEDKNIQWDPISEHLGRLTGISRQGTEQQVILLGQNDGSADGTVNPTAGPDGAVVAVTPSAKYQFGTDYPNVPVGWIQIQNANGDWVEPTPDSINKAIAASDTPLYALTNKVPGAYPLTWVENLYAPATGLTIEKTEAVAGYIRYLATVGQTFTTAVGEGQLTDALKAKALAAADALVKSNCVGSDRQVVMSTDPGPYVPTAVAAANIGSVAHCVAKAADTPTTAPASSGGSTASALPFDSSFTGLSDSSNVTSTPTATASTTPSASAPKTVYAVQSAAKSLPYPLLPQQPGTTLDEFVTRGLGAVIALLLIGRRRKAAA